MVTFTAVLGQMWAGLKQIFSSPFYDLSIWWLLLPLILLWIVLELYFGEHKKEQLGWNTALGNGISLVWVNVEAMRFLFASKPEPFWLRFIFIFLILAYGIFIIYISFTHKFSTKVTYMMAAPSPIYYLSVVSILWGHGKLEMTWWVMLDFILLFPVVLGIFYLLKRFMPESGNDTNSADSGFNDLKL